MNKLVVVDAGHGGNDPGAIGWQNNRESDLAMLYAVDLVQRINEVSLHQDEYVHAVGTRLTDRNVSLRDRATIANLLKADLFVSIHCNAWQEPHAEGFEVWTSPGMTDADDIADEIVVEVERRVAGAYPTRMRGLYEARFAVLMLTRMPAILIELGFITNQAECSRLLTADYQDRICEAIQIAIFRWLNG